MSTIKPRIGYTPSTKGSVADSEFIFDWITNAALAHGMTRSEFVASIVEPVLKAQYAKYNPNRQGKSNVRAMHAKKQQPQEQEWRFIN